MNARTIDKKGFAQILEDEKNNEVPTLYVSAKDEIGFLILKTWKRL
jgi:hypothetical protein